MKRKRVINVVYGSERFPVQDITFKNARKQSQVADELMKEMKRTQPENNLISEVPQSPIIERAIKYYEEHAEGEFKVLYKSTALWLRELMSVSLKERKAALKDVEECEEQSIEEVNFNEEED